MTLRSFECLRNDLKFWLWPIFESLNFAAAGSSRNARNDVCTARLKEKGLCFYFGQLIFHFASRSNLQISLFFVCSKGSLFDIHSTIATTTKTRKKRAKKKKKNKQISNLKYDNMKFSKKNGKEQIHQSINNS